MVAVRVSLPVPGRWNYEAIRLRVPDKATGGRAMRNPSDGAGAKWRGSASRFFLGLG